MKNPNSLFENHFIIDSSVKKHTRIAYNLFNLLSDLAGIFELIVGFTGIVFYKISKKNFVINAIMKMFYINIKHTLFNNGGNRVRIEGRSLQENYRVKFDL